MSESLIQMRQLEVHGRTARIYEGGDGAALLLLHGGWGGASLHWSRVWDRLARQYHIVAPDLPGLGQIDQPALASVREYVKWLIALLDLLGIEWAHCLGNSFGGSLAWSMAGHAPHRCRDLVLVNAIPLPRTPPLMLWLGRTVPGHALMRAILGRVSYHPRALARAFADPSRAPSELFQMLAQRGSVLLSRFTRLIVAGDGAPSPSVSPLLLWGQDDRLIGTRLANAQKLHAAVPGSTLRLIADAGHFPQLEAPEEFIKQLEAFIH